MKRNLFVLALVVLAAVSAAASPVAQEIRGGVEVRAPRTTSWQSLSPGDEIQAGARLRTRLGARVIVKLDDGSRLTLRENSIFEVVRSTAGRHEFRLWQGELRNVVMPVPSGGYYNVMTPVAAAGVRGTDFEMNVQEDGATKLRVYEGSVAFRSTVGSGAEVLVGAGQQSNANTQGEVTQAQAASGSAPNDAPAGATAEGGVTIAGLRIESPIGGAVLSSGSVTVFGSAAPGAQVTVNGVSATADAIGRFTAQLTLADGPQTIVAESDGEQASVAVTVDGSAPGLELDEFPALTTNSVVTLSVRTAPGATVSAGGVSVQAPGGLASIPLTLSSGENLVTIGVVGANGKSSSRTIRIVVDMTPPTLTILGVTSVSSGHRLVGITEPGATVYANNFPLTPRADGSFDEVVSGLASPVTFEARDEAGNVTRDVRNAAGSVDNEPPAFSSLAYNPPVTDNGATVGISLVASDLSGLTGSLALTLSGPAGSTLTTTLSADGSGYTGILSIPVTAASGVYTTNALTLSDALGNVTTVSPGTTLTISNAAPTTPTGVSVSDPGSGGSLTVSWAGVSDADFSVYHLFQATASGGPYSLVTSTGSTSANVANLTNGTNYFFVVKAQDRTGNYSLPSSEASGIPTKNTAPATPSGLAATGVTASGATLAWSPSSGAFTYKIYRSLSASGGSPYANIGQTGSTSFNVTGLSPNTTYHFAVTALDNNPTPNESAVGANEIAVTTSGGGAGL